MRCSYQCRTQRYCNQVNCIGPLEIAKPLLLWVNDGLMAGFFFLVGLELKRELLVGELSDRSKLVLPAVGAIGGMLVPSLIYAAMNYQDPVALRGWAIPSFTADSLLLHMYSRADEQKRTGNNRHVYFCGDCHVGGPA